MYYCTQNSDHSYEYEDMQRLLKGLCTKFTNNPFEIKGDIVTVKTTNLDYDLVIKRLHLYYDMRLAALGIDRDREFDNTISGYSHTHKSHRYNIKLKQYQFLL